MAEKVSGKEAWRWRWWQWRSRLKELPKQLLMEHSIWLEGALVAGVAGVALFMMWSLLWAKPQVPGTLPRLGRLNVEGLTNVMEWFKERQQSVDSGWVLPEGRQYFVTSD